MGPSFQDSPRGSGLSDALDRTLAPARGASSRVEAGDVAVALAIRVDVAAHEGWSFRSAVRVRGADGASARTVADPAAPAHAGTPVAMVRSAGAAIVTELLFRAAPRRTVAAILSERRSPSGSQDRGRPGNGSARSDPLQHPPSGDAGVWLVGRGLLWSHVITPFSGSIRPPVAAKSAYLRTAGPHPQDVGFLS